MKIHSMQNKTDGFLLFEFVIALAICLFAFLLVSQSLGRLSTYLSRHLDVLLVQPIMQDQQMMQHTVLVQENHDLRTLSNCVWMVEKKDGQELKKAVPYLVIL